MAELVRMDCSRAGKLSSSKDHIPRDTDMSGGRVKAPKTFMIRAISNENTGCATIRQFIICVRTKVGKTLTSKGSKICEIEMEMK